MHEPLTTCHCAWSPRGPRLGALHVNLGFFPFLSQVFTDIPSSSFSRASCACQFSLRISSFWPLASFCIGGLDWKVERDAAELSSRANSSSSIVSIVSIAKRFPSKDSMAQQDMTRSAYPPEAKGDAKGDITSNAHPASKDTPYATGKSSTTVYTGHRKTDVEQLEEHEHRRFGTRLFGYFYDTFVAGWRAGLIRAFILSLVALIGNIVIYAWLFATYDRSSDTTTVITGGCNMVRKANTGIHAALNVVSTLVLGASTYAMQGMTAPTREDVDTAHAKGKWVEIGTLSVRNLFHVRKRTVWIWGVLVLTSLPFHLL